LSNAGVNEVSGSTKRLVNVHKSKRSLKRRKKKIFLSFPQRS